MENRRARTGKRRSYWLRFGLFVLFLAMVVSVGVALRPDRRPESPNAASLSMVAYDRAVKSQASGETTEAIRLLEEALTRDPANQLALTALADIKAKQTRDAESGNPVSPAPDVPVSPELPSDEQYTRPVDDLATFLPRAVEGYDLGTPVTDGSDAIVAGTPEGSGSIESNVLWAVHDLQDPSGAPAFLDRTSKALYPKDSAQVTVGSTTAYFGTDGTRFASVSWVRGRFAFELVMSSGGVSPVELKSAAVAAATAFLQLP
ncbi:MAG: tetratricopeptide repeat protein [Actinobacteria bacterium]|nr:tetratricopeptide repeat protein [Actinomycetota bacterium]MCG2806690.1 tetratricopeptide repeat protein [Coriobacteriia bacterium]